MVKPLLDRNARVGLPVVDENRRQQDEPQRQPTLRSPFAVDLHAAASEKVERGLAPNHGKHRVVGQAQFLALGVFERDRVVLDVLYLTGHQQADRSRLAALLHKGTAAGSNPLGRRGIHGYVGHWIGREHV